MVRKLNIHRNRYELPDRLAGAYQNNRDQIHIKLSETKKQALPWLNIKTSLFKSKVIN